MELQLKKMRKDRGLRQEDLAELLYSTPRIVGAWEREETPIPLVDAARVADIFGCTLDELAGREWPAESLAPEESALLSDYRATDPTWQQVISEQAANAAKEHPKTAVPGIQGRVA